jgi:hypothetical protein
MVMWLGTVKKGRVLENRREEWEEWEEWKELHVLVVENHTFCCDIPQILIVVLGIFFNKPWNYIVILIHVFSSTEKHRLL